VVSDKGRSADVPGQPNFDRKSHWDPFFGVTLRAKLATTQPAGIEVSDQETRKEFPGIFSAKQGAKLRHPWDRANSNVQLYVPLQKTEGAILDRVFLGHHLANTFPECGRICRVLTTRSSSQSEGAENVIRFWGERFDQR
jgi:hypothetical protein